MSETSHSPELKPRDPELTRSQIAVKALCDEILALRPEGSTVTFKTVDSNHNPDEVQERIRESALGDLMLKDGDSLSATHSDERYPDLGLIVGEAKLIAVELGAWGWLDEKYRIDPNGPENPPYTIIEYPGEKDWTYKLDIRLWYSNGTNAASQTLTAYTASSWAGKYPLMSRDVFAPEYFETGYEGHNRSHHEVQSDEEVLDFVTLARELFESRTAEN